MLKVLANEARFTLRIEAIGPLLVKSGHATLDGPDMAPVRTYRNNQWQYYLPGSSLKGVVRSHVEKIIRTLRPGVVCNPFIRQAGGAQTPADVSCGARLEGGSTTTIDPESLYAESCPACRLFGSTMYAGRASLSDAYAANDVSIRTEIRDGVGIDRLTGGASNRAKFDLQAVSAGAAFTTEVVVRNFECWQLGALLLTLTDFEDGLIAVGSGRSRGLGAVRGSLAPSGVSIHTVGVPSEQGAAEVWGIGRFLGDGRYGTAADDVLVLSEAPERERRGVRSVATYRGDVLQELRDAATGAFVARIDRWVAPQATARGQAPVGQRGDRR